MARWAILIVAISLCSGLAEENAQVMQFYNKAQHKSAGNFFTFLSRREKTFAKKMASSSSTTTTSRPSSSPRSWCLWSSTPLGAATAKSWNQVWVSSLDNYTNC